MIDFGKTNPKEMPMHLFFGAVHLDYDSATKADISKQNYGVCPRYWYLDATFRCNRCGRNFVFSSSEQRHWYEELFFWVDAFPKNCLACRKQLREITELRKEYDRDIAQVLEGGDLQMKKRLALVIDSLYESGGDLPQQINENRQRLANQIARLESSA